MNLAELRKLVKNLETYIDGMEIQQKKLVDLQTKFVLNERTEYMTLLGLMGYMIENNNLVIGTMRMQLIDLKEGLKG